MAYNGNNKQKGIKSMRLISDKSIIGRDRRIVLFRLEENDSPAETVCLLSGIFSQPCAVVKTPIGEHRLPAGVCGNIDLMKKSLEEVKILSIEIGEGKGKTDVIFTVDYSLGDLTCTGPLEYDFYSLLIGYGLNFSL